MANNLDWIGLMQRAKKAYTPTFGQRVLQPFGQAVGQGFVGRRIAEDELRKAIMTTMMGKYTPMVGEEPATMKQIMGAMRGKPGVIPSLFGAKPPEELTWKPIETTKYAEEYPWKAQLETFKSGLQAILDEQKFKNQKELERLKTELGVETPLTKEKVRKLEYENRQLGLMVETMEEAFGKARGKTVPDVINDFIKGIITGFARKISVKMPEAKTPTEGIPPTGVQGELPGMEVTPTPTPTEALIPDWLPEDVKARVRALQEAGATEEEIQEIINYYRR